MTHKEERINLKRKLGKEGEVIAIEFLEENGYSIFHTNWRFGHKEVDIIAGKEGLLAFIEVKTRRKSTVLNPATLFTIKQQRHYIMAGYSYMEQFGMLEYQATFDIICIHSSTGTVEHWSNVIDVRNIMGSSNASW